MSLKHVVLLQVQLLQQRKLAPSNSTWRVMQHCTILPDITVLIGLEGSAPRVNNRCQGCSDEFCKDIWCNSDPTNEGHSTLLCGTVLGHIVTDLNAIVTEGEQKYKFEIFPVVKEEDDRRYNKLSDYSIFRIFNKIIYAILEVKLRVGTKLTNADKDDLAQLFLEVLYLHEDEKNVVVEKPMCILTDGYSWHFILTDVSKRPFEFVQLFTIITKGNWGLSTSTICNIMLSHVETTA